MPGADRQVFMARVRAALKHARTQSPAEPAPSVNESVVRRVEAGPELTERFATEATGSGMVVHRVSSEDLVREIMSVLAPLSARRVVVGVGTVPQGLSLFDSLRRKGIEIVDWKACEGLEVQYDVDAGITDVHAAIAETGTLVCYADAGHSRGLSLVPPVHVAIVRKSDIVPDLIDFYGRLKGIAGAELSSSMTFITGPSKTADIEGELVVGVHGPGQVHVMVVENL